jgi:hypothetical protein
MNEMCAGAHAAIAPEWLNTFNFYLIVKSLSILGWCPVNLNIPASKTGSFRMGLKTQNGNFLKLGSNDFD